jgi:ATP-dependent Clp protease adaptor protein ClpS
MASEQTYSSAEAEEGIQDVHAEPPRYTVYLHNDDYTTMDFVVDILVTVFHKPPPEAFAIMMCIHNKGRGACGVYSREIAEARVCAVRERAEANGFPLLCTMEREEE